MPHQVLRSLKHEYQVFIESEIERYKDSVSRHSLLGIADEAVAVLRSQTQYEPEELSLCAEVDRLIARRIKLPKYSTWQRKRLKRLAEYRKPETWGIAPDGPCLPGWMSQGSSSRATRSAGATETGRPTTQT